MFCSWRSGCASINEAWDRLTKAPEDGFNRQLARSNMRKLGARLIHSNERVKKIPPPRISAPAFPGVAQDAEDGFNRVADQGGYAEHQADLSVGQAQVTAD